MLRHSRGLAHPGGHSLGRGGPAGLPRDLRPCRGLLSGPLHVARSALARNQRLGAADPAGQIYQSERFRRECSTLLLAAQRAAAGGTDTYRGREVTPIYTYRASTLIERLQITPDEERQMTRLISDGEKYRRKMEGAGRQACKSGRLGWLNTDCHRINHGVQKASVAQRGIAAPDRETGPFYFYLLRSPRREKAEFLPAGGLSLGHQGTNGSGFCKHQTRA